MKKSNSSSEDMTTESQALLINRFFFLTELYTSK